VDEAAGREGAIKHDYKCNVWARNAGVPHGTGACCGLLGNAVWLSLWLAPLTVRFGKTTSRTAKLFAAASVRARNGSRNQQVGTPQTRASRHSLDLAPRVR